MLLIKDVISFTACDSVTERRRVEGGFEGSRRIPSGKFFLSYGSATETGERDIGVKDERAKENERWRK